MKLADIASVLRSKNAGPCLVTFDLMFHEAAAFEHARSQTDRLRAAVALAYGRQEAEVRVIDYVPARAIKITLPRDVVSGAPGDRDVYGAQQHAPLLEIEL
jgi:hypothetical protein